MAEQFIVRDHFKREISDNAPVKISWLGDYFKLWFLDKIEEAQNAAIPRFHHELSRPSEDKDIIGELGGEAKAETTLAGIYKLMKAQNNGQPGGLLTNGYRNIFYVRDVSGILRDVDVNWCGGRWELGADSVDSWVWQDAGSRVFSRGF